MTVWTVTIAKAETADGYWKLRPDGQKKVGDMVDIDLDSRRTEEYHRKDNGQKYMTEIVNEVTPDGRYNGPWPVELLEGI